MGFSNILKTFAKILIKLYIPDVINLKFVIALCFFFLIQTSAFDIGKVFESRHLVTPEAATGGVL